MPAKRPAGSDDESKTGPPGDVTSATKVNVAFPFSQIKVEEPSDDLRVLAALVRDLSEQVVQLAPSEEATAIAERAGALAQRLG